MGRAAAKLLDFGSDPFYRMSSKQWIGKGSGTNLDASSMGTQGLRGVRRFRQRKDGPIRINSRFCTVATRLCTSR